MAQLSVCKRGDGYAVTIGRRGRAVATFPKRARARAMANTLNGQSELAEGARRALGLRESRST